MNVKTEKIVTDAEAKDLLEKRATEIETKYEQKNALDHLKKFTKIHIKKVDAMTKELEGIEKLRERQIVAIANFLPENQDDLRAILHRGYTSFSPEEVNKILEIVKKNA